jgi:hypothetical protein
MSRLPDHLNPPAIIETITRYECPKCGNNCSCGVPYVPKTMRAAEAIRANPDKSNRMIAEEIGADEKTVRRARADYAAPATITGRDGKTYPATKSQEEPTMRPEPPNLIAQANKHLDRILPLIWEMKPQERTMFRTMALQKMADAATHAPNEDGVIEF